jgi:high affinity Mn2+ porin
MGFLNRSHAGKYSEAIANPGPSGPDITLSRSFRDKYGFSITADQQVTEDLGVFARLGWNDGHTETWAFTEIDRSASIGLSLKGTGWHRPDDVVGVAGVINALAHDHREYLGADGYGFIIGDGQLPHYAPEQIVEAYYFFKMMDHVFITPDAQFINHPAYNSDRGPVFVGGLRVHIEF